MIIWRKHRRRIDPVEELTSAIREIKGLISSTLDGQIAQGELSTVTTEEEQQSEEEQPSPTTPPVTEPLTAAQIAQQLLLETTGIGRAARGLSAISDRLANATGIPAVVGALTGVFQALRAVVDTLRALGPLLDQIYVGSVDLRPQIMDATRRIQPHTWPRGRERAVQMTDFVGTTPVYDPESKQSTTVERQ